jgi:excinuclease ABC subunit C
MDEPARALRPDPGTVPDAPGCYLFSDAHGRVLYVGKARSLRSRVASYFGAPDGLAPRTRSMLAAARSLDWMVVATEAEALHLEWTLIQRHAPRYNVVFRDDKSYPELVLTTSEAVPRARIQRGAVDRADRRFGPYVSANDIRETLDLLIRVFPVRSCSKGVFDRARSSGRPCLLHHIGRCAAPCTGEIGVEEHRALVGDLAAFLDGASAPVLERLEREMHDASDAQRYEVAARRRDQLEAARRVVARQQVVWPDEADLDALAFHGDELEVRVHVFLVRRGRLVGQTGWTLERTEGLSTEELVTTSLVQLYADRVDDVPPVVLVPAEPAEADVLSELLTERRRASGRATAARVRFTVPRRGDRLAFLRTVEDNARSAFQRGRLKRASDLDARSRALTELASALGLEEAPLRIECYDVSHLGGTGVVASMVVLEDGLPRPRAYRSFKLRVDQNDDPAAMREVVRRRFERLLKEQAAPVPPGGEPRSFAYPPQLVIVDGGPTQLAAALEGVADLPLEGVAFAALAKRHEELWLPGASEPVVLPRGSEALYLVQRVRDEAHRFALRHQRRRRRTAVTTSALDRVPGIGPARRRDLLARFGSVAAVLRASDDELLAVPGVSPTIVAALRSELGNGAQGDPAADGAALPDSGPVADAAPDADEVSVG